MNKLQIYNEALLLCGQTKLSALTDNVESRYVLDSVWDADLVNRCLASGQWQFATRAVQLDYDPSVSPTFGFSRAFQKPSDFVRVAAVCSDQYFDIPLPDYTEEAGYWFADLDTIYVKYVSNDSSYGADYSLWLPSFGDYVIAFLASRAITRLSQDKERIRFLLGTKRDPGEAERRLRIAKSHDGQAEPTKSPVTGSWVNSRISSGNRERGSRSNLIG